MKTIVLILVIALLGVQSFRLGYKKNECEHTIGNSVYNPDGRFQSVTTDYKKVREAMALENTNYFVMIAGFAGNDTIYYYEFEHLKD